MPRAGLTRDVVVAEAARIADEEGYDQLTLALVAKRFGVAVPSLYKHVDGLDAVRRELAVLAIRELGEALAAGAAGRNGQPALCAMAHAYRHYAQAHPGRYAATVRAPDPADRELTARAQALLDTVYSVLAGYGLAGADAVDATRALRAALHGFVALQAAGGFGMPQDVDRSFTRMIEALDVALRQWKQARRKDPTR